MTLAEQVGSYSVFPDDGIRIAPHYIRKVRRWTGRWLEQKTPEVREVISVDIAREMMVLLQAVTQHGNGGGDAVAEACVRRQDGNDEQLYGCVVYRVLASVTCGTWIGFDDRETLGEKETGAKAALPMWMDFMKVAIADKPNEVFATANAPKKQLEVPTAAPVGDALPKKHPVVPEPPDVGDTEDAVPAAAKPVSPAPASKAPEGMPDDSAPVVPKTAPGKKPQGI